MGLGTHSSWGGACRRQATATGAAGAAASPAPAGTGLGVNTVIPADTTAMLLMRSVAALVTHVFIRLLPQSCDTVDDAQGTPRVCLHSALATCSRKQFAAQAQYLVVDEGGAGMQHGMVVEQLDVAGL